MRVLLVGGGATAMALAYALRESGVEVGFLLRASHADRPLAARVQIGRGTRRVIERNVVLSPRFLGDLEQASAWAPDVVVFTLSAPQMEAFSPHDVLRLVGDGVGVVVAPGPGPQAALSALPEERRGFLLVAFMAAGVPWGEKEPQAWLVWDPPLATSFMGGADPRLGEVVDALRRGGLAVKWKRNGAISQLPSGLLQPLVLALEASGWSFRALRRDRALLQLLRSAQGEALSAIARLEGRSGAGAWHLLPGTTMMRLLLWADTMAPFSVERFLQAHFTKVGDQTAGWVTVLKGVMPVPSLEELARRAGRHPEEVAET